MYGLGGLSLGNGASHGHNQPGAAGQRQGALRGGVLPHCPQIGRAAKSLVLLNRESSSNDENPPVLPVVVVDWSCLVAIPTHQENLV